MSYGFAWLAVIAAIAAHSLGLGDLALAAGLVAVIALGLDIAQLVRLGGWAIRPMTPGELAALDTRTDLASSLSLDNIWYESGSDESGIAFDWRGG